jgi:hypothetical protein
MFKKDSEQSKNIPIYSMIDERTKAIVYRGDAYTGRFMLFAVLLDVIIREFRLSDPITTSNWDLMLIVIIGGLISTAYQIKSKVVFNRPFYRSFLFIILLMGLSAIIAYFAAFFFTK